MSQLVGQPRRRRSKAGPFAPIKDTSEKLAAVIEYRNSRRTQEVRPWIPADYATLPEERRQALLTHFRHYLVVDDLEEDAESGTAVLIVTPWPGIDLQGRLRFTRTADGERVDEVIGRDIAAFSAFVNQFRCRINEHGFPVSGFAGDDRVLQRRPIRIGDVFALNDAARLAVRGEETSDQILLFDISGAARELAKISYYAAAAGVLDATDNEELARLAWEEQDTQ